MLTSTRRVSSRAPRAAASITPDRRRSMYHVPPTQSWADVQLPRRAAGCCSSLEVVRWGVLKRGGSLLSWWVISPYLPHSMTFTDPLSRPPRIQMTPHIPTPRQDSSRLSAARRRPPPPLQTTMMTTVVSPAAVGMAAAAVGMAVVGSILARQTAISPRSTSRRHLRRPSSTMYTKLPVRHSSASSLL